MLTDRNLEFDILQFRRTLRNVDQPPSLGQLETKVCRRLQNRRSPSHPARIILPQNGEQKALAIVDLFETSKHFCGHRGDIARTDLQGPVFPIGPKHKAPAPGVDDEHLRSVMAVLGIDAAERLASAADIKSVLFGDVDVLVRAFRNPRTDDGKILFFR